MPVATTSTRRTAPSENVLDAFHTTGPSPTRKSTPTATSGVTLLPPLALEHGGTLERGRLAWRCYGNPSHPALLVLGGISAHRHIARCEEDTRCGWWEDLVGAGKGIDTDRFFVIGIDWLGGSGSSTHPSELPRLHGDIPALTPADQARAIGALLDSLGIDALHACIGASYGGMVALALGAHSSTRVRSLVVLGAAHTPHPMATALRSLQRSVVQLGVERGAPQDALRLARGIAVTTYRSAREFAGRFQVLPAIDESGVHFEVEDYLDHQGRGFAERFSPESFLCLSQSIDLHSVEPAAVRVPTTLVAFDPDAITPAWQVRELARHLRGRWTLRLVPSVFGHDAFLKEVPAVTRIVSAALSQEVV